MIDTIVVVDTETSGLSPTEGAELLEVAWVPLTLENGAWGWTEGAEGCTFVEHEGEIPPQARAVHHISPDDVAPGAERCSPTDVVVGDMLRAETPELTYAAHNAAFDRQFLPLGRPFICTLQCAKHLWPEAPAYGNQVLRYWLGCEPPADLLKERFRDEEDMPAVRPLAPHRALYDAAVTAAVLLRMLGGRSAEELVELTVRPVLLRTCQFNKHRGTPWAEVPRDYLRWIARTPDMMRDPDLAHTVAHYLRGAA